MTLPWFFQRSITIKCSLSVLRSLVRTLAIYVISSTTVIIPRTTFSPKRAVMNDIEHHWHCFHPLQLKINPFNTKISRTAATTTNPCTHCPSVIRILPRIILPMLSSPELLLPKVLLSFQKLLTTVISELQLL